MFFPSLPSASVSNEVLVLSFENEFDFHENEPVSEKHFHMNSFARTLAFSHEAEKN